MTVADICVDWTDVLDTDTSIFIETRTNPISDVGLKLLQAAPFAYRTEGTLEEVLVDLAALPSELLSDISQLGSRFMQLMQVDNVHVRLEGVTSNACKKLHADYTDLRLITTYAGPGTDYAPHGDADCCLERLPTGAIGLFKGKLFGPGHTPCLHRSPPIEGTDAARLVLVIDTPERQEFQ